MNVYLYRAALHCEACGEDIAAQLPTPDEFPDESKYDSDNYPKGPYTDGGGEADCPNHCDTCGVFLENPLTNDGYTYVREAVAEKLDEVTSLWQKFYGVLTD